MGTWSNIKGWGNSIVNAASDVGDFVGNVATLGGQRRAGAQAGALEGQQEDIGKIMSTIGGQKEADLAELQRAYGPMLENAPEYMRQYAQAAQSPLDLSRYETGAAPDMSKYGYQQAPQFAQTGVKSAQDFLDPSLQYQIQMANKSLEGSAANRGKLFSGATGQAISENTRKMGETGYQQAQQLAQQANQTGWSQQHQTWADQIANDRAALAQRGNLAQQSWQNQMGANQQNAGLAQNQYSTRLNALQGLSGAAGQAVAGKMNVGQQYNQQLNQGELQRAGLKAQQAGVDTSFMGNLMQAAPAWVEMGTKVAKAVG